jgi:hypothetical protein
MIIKGGARRAGGFFAHHLMKAEDNERVTIAEMKGLYAENLPEAFNELRALAGGSRDRDYFYHASMNPREDEHLTPEQWDFAVDRLEQNLKMDGHARFQVEHEKEGRTHRHIVWSRVDPETLTLANHWRNYEAHDRTRHELEQAFNHEPTPQTPEPSQRRSREFSDWENFRAQESGIDPKQVKTEITALFQSSDSGPAFTAALDEAGYTICRGDKRDALCVIDQAGDVHSLSRRIHGIRTAELRQFMGDIDPLTLPSVKEASEFVKARDPENLPQQTAAGGQEKQLDPQALTAPEPQGYTSPATAKEFAALQKAMLPSFDNQAAQEQQHAWNTLEARRAEIAAPHAATVKDEHDDLWENWLNRHPENDKELER